MRKRVISAQCVQRFFHTSHSRNMHCAQWKTRCVRIGEIHEIVTTDQDSVDNAVPRVGFLGFFEFRKGGVVEKGDSVILRGEKIGEVLGFDECHFPNHYNVIIRCDLLYTADTLGVSLDEKISFEGELEDKFNVDQTRSHLINAKLL